jgi:hypothetical protein
MFYRRRVSGWLFLLTVSSLMLCTSQIGAASEKSGVKMANHAFDFGSAGIPDSPGIEILNFQYGDSKVTGTYVEDAWLATGHVGQGGGVSGNMPVGDFLYVKWRVLATGKVYEDRVDLKGRLPSNMDHKIIHFAVKEQQLNIYLIEGNTSTQLHAPGRPDCPAASYEPYQCTRIYPDHWANF